MPSNFHPTLKKTQIQPYKVIPKLQLNLQQTVIKFKNLFEIKPYTNLKPTRNKTLTQP